MTTVVLIVRQRSSTLATQWSLTTLYLEAKMAQQHSKTSVLPVIVATSLKARQQKMEEPLASKTVPLFHPRKQEWQEHFGWDGAGIRVEGLTAIGRATIIALKMNNEVIVHARQTWVSAGWHPPEL